MSSFTCICRNKKTNKLTEVFCWDNYFGPHIYGYQVVLSGPVMTEGEFGKLYERVEGSAPAQDGKGV